MLLVQKNLHKIYKHSLESIEISENARNKAVT
jgi:hypothetical protein